MSQPTPAVGRIVHYVSHGSPVLPDGSQRYEPTRRAAIIAAVPELLSEGPNSGPEGYVPAVSLAVLNPTGMFFDQEVPYADPAGPAGLVGGTWHWPERV
ncbi:hypothetical protein [Streptomyces sp. NPDC059015]|uniref:hypothetical protein n=1 Tax=unclassified Streptomyces TaxID=2593676 RepID=UPI0036926098